MDYTLLSLIVFVAIVFWIVAHRNRSIVDELERRVEDNREKNLAIKDSLILKMRADRLIARICPKRPVKDLLRDMNELIKLKQTLRRNYEIYYLVGHDELEDISDAVTRLGNIVDEKEKQLQSLQDKI